MEETTLFDPDGNSVAYIAPDDENTIYLWSGKPVAYLEGENIYGFNGKHLGWFEEGIIWDHDGNRVGFIKGTLPVFAKFEPFKAFKQFKPFKVSKSWHRLSHLSQSAFLKPHFPYFFAEVRNEPNGR